MLPGVRSHLPEHIFIPLYLLFLVSGFLFAVFRVRIPLVPEPLLQLSYQAMAPYQNYSIYNLDLVAEGKLKDGVWNPIDLDPYLPFAPGERLVRIQMSTFDARGGDALTDAYRTWAGDVRRLEEDTGRNFRTVRIWNDRWPSSPEGISALRRSPFIERQLVVEIP